MFNLFKKKEVVSVDLIDFSAQFIATGKIGGYILNFLYKELGFRHIGYRIDNCNGQLRCVLYTLPGNKFIEQYFKDRCSGMIEEKVMTMEAVPHSYNTWINGFEEVTEYRE